MAVNYMAIDRLRLDEAFTTKMLHRAFSECWTVKCDKQLLKNIQGGIADCALFDDKQFRFVEFKTNAEGRTEKAATNTFDKATCQLKNTIRLFCDSLQRVAVKFEDAVTLGCHIVLPRTFPVSHSLMQDYQIAFATDTDGIMLSFDSETQWEEPAESI